MSYIHFFMQLKRQYANDNGSVNTDKFNYYIITRHMRQIWDKWNVVVGMITEYSKLQLCCRIHETSIKTFQQSPRHHQQIYCIS